ncbi:MAG: PBECR2 nuclease fold domain-containing protein [bacterium]
MTKNYRTVFGEKVYLSDSKWDHIEKRHPEVKRFMSFFCEVLSTPDIVKISRKDKNVHLYYKYFKKILGGKYLLVVTNSGKRIIITAFVTDKIKVGEMLWPKK